MLFHSWLRTLRTVLTLRGTKGKPARAPRRQPAGSFRPRLEMLEDRTAPAVLTVNSMADTASAADAYLSLREAIAIVSSPTLPTGLSSEITGQISGTLHDGGSDTIQFDHSSVIGPIVLAGGGLGFGLPSATAKITIDGGPARITIDGNHEVGLMWVGPGVDLTLNHLNLVNGGSYQPDVGETLGDQLDPGGAIWIVRGKVTVSECNLSENFAGGGTVGHYASGENGGGAIFNVGGTVSITGSNLTGNKVIARGEPAWGGAIDSLGGTITISNSTLSNNTAHGSHGNTALISGGAIATQGGSLTMTNCTLDNNSALQDGGGIYNVGGTVIIGSDSNPTFLTNNAAKRGGAIATIGGSMTLNHCTLSGNTGYVDGGGIYNHDGTVTITGNSSLSDNHATTGNGGGIYNQDGTVTITGNSSLSDNHATTGNGGGIYNTGGVVSSIHGVIFLGKLTMTSCNVDRNTAAADGGGIYNHGGWVTMTDSTLLDNSSLAHGGGMKTLGGLLSLDSCTIWNNTAGEAGGGIDIDPADATIIACTFFGNCAPLGADLFNLDSSVTIIASSVPNIYNQGGTVTDPLNVLLAHVATLNLNSGQTNSLTSKLRAAQQSLASANATAATNQLNAFINQLNALVNSHRLGELAADSLINEVDDLIELIG